MSSKIVFDKERLGEWASPARFMDSWGEFEAIGLEENGELIGVVVYNDYKQFNISMHLCAKGDWMQRPFIEAVFRYPFEQLKVNRVTAYVAGKRKDLQVFYERMFGFEHEGVMKQALEDDDLVIMGLVKNRCAWLRRFGTKSFIK